MKLEIKNLKVEADGKKILKGIDFIFETGKTYGIVGPNGNGKSTLLSSIMGDPNFDVTEGDIFIDGESIIDMEVFERAQKGIYLSMQHPVEIQGVSNSKLINSAINARGIKESLITTHMDMEDESTKLRMNKDMISRDVNVGFSGGEKKKNEILHMNLLKPTFAMLDEIDSGLDVDSIEAIATNIKENKSKDNSYIVISHYKKLFEIIKPDVLLIIKDGKVFKHGPYDELSDVLDKGFDLI